MKAADEDAREAAFPGAGHFQMRRNSHAHLDSILDQMIERPEELAQLAALIDEDFGEVRAVMVLDMSGFSRTTHHHGIVPFLLMIHQLKRIALPAVQKAGGIVVKAEADNLYCMFEDVAPAVAAARQILDRLDAVNPLLPEDRRLHAAIGIGFGRILNVDERDMFGAELNLASKLGEDIAKAGEILLTAAAKARADTSGIAARQREAKVSGLTFSLYELT